MAIKNSASGNLEILIQQAENRFYGHALATSGLAENAEAFTGMDLKADIFHQLFGDSAVPQRDI